MKCLPAVVAFAILLSAASLSVSRLCADDGGLTPEIVSHARKTFEMDPHTRAMFNAVTNNSLKDLALNRETLWQHNNLFSHKIDTKGITNQKSSGRCWLFAGLNVLRPAVIAKHNVDGFEFSQNYLAFWDKMEKANCFLETMIELADRDPLDREVQLLQQYALGDGGWWEYVVDLVDKYGVVPKDVMPETHSSESTSSMNWVIRRKLKLDALELQEMARAEKPLDKIRAAKKQMMADIYRMLAMNLGEPPTEFQWRYEDKESKLSELRTYTPVKFYKQWVDVDLSQYVNLTDDPTQAYGKHYQLHGTRNMFDSRDLHYVNVQASVLKELVLKSVLDDEPVWFAADVGKDQTSEHGIMAVGMYDYGSIFDVDLEMTKLQRLLSREGTPNHAMAFVGVDVQNDLPVKWRIENSWGADKGDDGYWTMYDGWFDRHVYQVIVKKAYVPNKILKRYQDDPITLPAWHPMAAMLTQ